jgi:hypothetical protein
MHPAILLIIISHVLKVNSNEQAPLIPGTTYTYIRDQVLCSNTCSSKLQSRFLHETWELLFAHHVTEVLYHSMTLTQVHYIHGVMMQFIFL